MTRYMKAWLPWLLACLCSSLALAGSIPGAPVSRGNFLHVPQYETTAAINLFVDPTGSDANPCTASGASACLTIQHAINLIPKLVRHPVTVNVATGNYAGFAIYNFVFDPVSAATGAYINVVGTAATATVATGSATGTATSGTAGSGTTWGTLVDGAQTWTVNDLKGKFIRITGGTGSGQFFPIVSNTATAITVAGTWTAPTGTSTYTVSVMGAIVTSSINQSAQPGVAAGTAVGILVQSNAVVRAPAATGASITLTRMGVSIAATRALTLAGAMSVSVVESSFAGTTSSVVNFASAVFGRVQNSIVTSTTASTVGVGIPPPGTLTISNSLFSSAGALGSTFQTSGVNGWQVASSDFSDSSSAAAAIIGIGNGLGSNDAQNMRFTLCHLTCTAGGTTVGFQGTLLNSINDNAIRGWPSVYSNTNTVANCPTGVLIDGPGFIGVKGTVFTGGSSVGLNATRHGSIFVDTSVANTFAGFANEVSVDGVTSTYAALLALTPPVISNLSYGSWIGH